MARAPLTPNQRDDLRDRLVARRRDLREEVDKALAASDDPRVSGLRNELAATEDWVLADILGDLEIGMVTRDVQELGEIEAAILRLEDASYGSCTDCGEPIGFPRLNAYPAAQRCVVCQQREESRSGRPAPPSL